jgi:proteic killer suppression protein
MQARHDDPDLEAAEMDPDYRGKWDAKIVRALVKVMNIVRNFAHNEGQLRAFRGLNFKPLEGDRSHQHSLKLNDQWRLIVEIEKRSGPNNNVLVVKEITDYHD